MSAINPRIEIVGPLVRDGMLLVIGNHTIEGPLPAFTIIVTEPCDLFIRDAAIHTAPPSEPPESK